MSDERHRIILDLHDGIGGHLVNTLTYIDNSKIDDPTHKSALEMALRDLSLMIDSLENSDRVSTLLGMFRSRIEPLLSQHGIQFKWEIGEEPDMPQKGPTPNLNLLRIVQEAATNSIKHAGCDEITIYTDKQTFRISDNGQGFDLNVDRKDANRRDDQAGGFSLISMQSRAKALDAQLDIKSSEQEAQTSISWA